MSGVARTAQGRVPWAHERGGGPPPTNTNERRDFFMGIRAAGHAGAGVPRRGRYRISQRPVAAWPPRGPPDPQYERAASFLHTNSGRDRRTRRRGALRTRVFGTGVRAAPRRWAFPSRTNRCAAGRRAVPLRWCSGTGAAAGRALRRVRRFQAGWIACHRAGAAVPSCAPALPIAARASPPARAPGAGAGACTRRIRFGSPARPGMIAPGPDRSSGDRTFPGHRRGDQGGSAGAGDRSARRTWRLPGQDASMRSLDPLRPHRHRAIHTNV